MNKIIYLLALMISVSACGPKGLDNNEVARILQLSEAYPKGMPYRIFCGNNEIATDIHNLGLDQQGLVVVRLKHTVDDVGKPLITFTEKAKPYLLETSEEQRAMDVQNVRLATEYFREVTTISTNASGNRAEVEFTTSLRDKTPFVGLSKESKDSIQSRMTYFTLTKDGWKWDGKIVKVRR